MLSYSRSDTELMKRVRDGLDVAGIKCWCDDALEPGTASWTKAIQSAIEDASLGVVVVLTPSAKKSQWVEKEILYALHQAKLIIPVLAAGDQSSSTPFQLIDVQHVDMRPGHDGGIERLTDILMERLNEISKRAWTQDLRFSIQYPKEIQPRVWYSLFAYVYHVKQAKDVGRDMAAMSQHGNANLLSPRPVTPIDSPSDVQLQIKPVDCRRLTFNPARTVIAVYDAWQRFHMEFFAEEHDADYDVEGAMALSLDPIDYEVTRVSMQLSVRPDAGKYEVARSDARVYRRIFACYSHRDSMIVEQMGRMLEALGDRYLRDCLDLRAGQTWSNRLKELIDEADVFQLFWSSNAARSGFVEAEWRYAHSLVQDGKKPPNFIRPVYWEEPIPTPVPPELENLHFQRLHFR
jgi:hypothetical protein